MQKSRSNSMFGTLEGGRRKRRAKAKKALGNNGNIIQNVTVNLRTKPIGEKPMYVDDSRIDAPRPYAAPRPIYSAPKIQHRPSPQYLFPVQQQNVEHNANGTITTNLHLANAMNQLANRIPQMIDGVHMFEAGKQQERLFLRQSNSIGGAGAAVQGTDNVPTVSRQEMLNRRYQSTEPLEDRFERIDRIATNAASRQLIAANLPDDGIETTDPVRPNVVQVPNNDVQETYVSRNNAASEIRRARENAGRVQYNDTQYRSQSAFPSLYGQARLRGLRV